MTKIQAFRLDQNWKKRLSSLLLVLLFLHCFSFLLIALSLTLPWLMFNGYDPALANILSAEDLFSAIEYWQKLLQEDATLRRFARDDVTQEEYGSGKSTVNKNLQTKLMQNYHVRKRQILQSTTKVYMNNIKIVPNIQPDKNNNFQIYPSSGQKSNFPIDLGPIDLDNDYMYLEPNKPSVELKDAPRKVVTKRGLFFICTTGYPCFKLNDKRLYSYGTALKKKERLSRNLIIGSVVLNGLEVVVGLILKFYIKSKTPAIILLSLVMVAFAFNVSILTASCSVYAHVAYTKEYIKIGSGIYFASLSALLQFIAMIVEIFEWKINGSLWIKKSGDNDAETIATDMSDY